MAEALTLQGVQCGSVNEYNVGKALERLKIPYQFQVVMGGSWGTRGSQKVDFVAYTAPKPTAIYVQGEYWHNKRTATEDMLKQMQAERLGYRALAILEKQCETIEQATAFLRREL